MTSGSEAEKKLRHAAQCDYCGALLRQTLADFSIELTAEEKRVIAEMTSIKTGWQRKFAKRLSSMSRAKTSPISQKDRFGIRWWTMSATWRRWAIAGATAIVLFSISWMVLFRRPSVNAAAQVNELLAQAYGEKRITELRIQGAAYSSVWMLRAGSGTESVLDRPAPLLDAESRIARELQSKPDDPIWLQIKARADLVEGRHFAPAIATLERVLETTPDDNSIRQDLAIAYFQRAEALNRPIDHGKAVDLLGAVLARQPNNTVVLFNRAILLERLFLYHQAEDDWKRYLELDPSSAWAKEARSRLAALQEKIHQRDTQSNLPIADPGQFAVIAISGTPEMISGLDSHVEMYLEVAIQSWIPKAFQRTAENKGESSAARSGLNALASMLASKHGDTWLRDFLKRAGDDPEFGTSATWLSLSYQASAARDDDKARVLARLAAGNFLRRGNEAGALYAHWEQLYASRLSLRGKECFGLAQELWNMLKETSYYWLQARTLLDYSACANSSSHIRMAARLSNTGSRMSEKHGYPDLYLRNLKWSADIDSEIDGSATSLDRAITGLRQFWSASVGYMPGYNLYSAIDYDSEFEQLWHLDVAVIKEGLQLLVADPDLSMRAAQHQRLANALLRSGDSRGAEVHLLQAIELLDVLPPGESVRNNVADVAISIAGVDVLQGDPQRAISRLKAIGERVEGAGNADLSFDFFSVFGKALVEVGQYRNAEAAFVRALRFAERGLQTISTEHERLLWSRRAGPVYRELVHLKLRDDPHAAFWWWEWFKGASVRGRASQKFALIPMSQTSFLLSSSAERALHQKSRVGSAAIVSYAVFPEGIAVWVYDRSGVRYRWIAISVQRLETASGRFNAYCSDPTSDIQGIRQIGQELYGVLWKPIEDLTQADSEFIIETDGALDRLPFGVLVDSAGTYLGDRSNLSFSSGFYYLLASSAPPPLTRSSHALVVADSASHPEMQLSDLPDVEAEARTVASAFRSATLLLRGDANWFEITRALPRSELLHFSGHASIDANTSGLVLGGSHYGERSLLSAIELSHASLRQMRMVVLSACETAQGSHGSFGDSESLARTLISSGVPQVIASRWPVNSDATRELMKQFYPTLLAGKPASQALRIAGTRLRDQSEWKHPFYWAAFDVFGRV